MANFYDRVLETTTTTGTGNISLAGAPANYVTFGSVLANAATCCYIIVDNTNSAWECGVGTYNTSGNTLSRTAVTASSSAGSAVNLAAGTKQVFVAATASFLTKVPQTNASNTFTQSQTVSSSGDGEQLTLLNTTYGRSIRFGWESGGATPHINADDSLVLRAGNLVQMLPNGSTYGIQFGAPNANDRTMNNQVGDLIINSTNSGFKPLVVRGSSGQTADLQQWQNSSNTPLAKIDSNGGIVLASMSNSTAANGTMYYSTDANKPVFKDSVGAVNPLY